MSIWLSHPTGNAFVRAILAEMKRSEMDFRFFTTIGYPAPRKSRRAYDLPPENLFTRPALETVRLAAERFSRGHARSILARLTDTVFEDLDRSVAAKLREVKKAPESVYAYEDTALETFRAAAERGISRVYDLPIAYWETVQRILREEAERLPRWEPTLGATRDSAEKLERKSREIALADCVVCPSRFVFDSLPPAVRESRRCVISEFGSPLIADDAPAKRSGSLRVLFAGSLTQRKGLADLFAAMKRLRSRHVELIVFGPAVVPMSFYRREYSAFRYEAPRGHSAVLALMRSCDLLVLPSLVEGRALVQQEALACGLPLVITANAGGEDLIDAGETGFIVPIRAPDAIASRIEYFAAHRDQLEEMRPLCRAKAREYTWKRYAQRILEAVASESAAQPV